MLTEDLLPLLPRFVDSGRGPSHDELSRLIARTGLTAGDPPRPEGVSVGKVMRVRSVLAFALDRDPTAGAQFVKMYVDQVRARGGFRAADPNCPGVDTIDALRRAFKNVGYGLDADGVLRPTLFEALEGATMTEALWSYVRRARTGAEDPELVIGTAKNLEEAVIRHVLKEKTGTYATSGSQSHFPTSLFSAYYALGLTGSPIELDKDPYKAIQQALFLLACAVNRLRNDRGMRPPAPGNHFARVGWSVSDGTSRHVSP
jgi:hypothetical protein